MKSTEEQFREMFARRGADLSISPGAFADGKLVAFTLNAVDRHQNVMTAYDLGSGVPEDLKLSAVRLLHL